MDYIVALYSYENLCSLFASYPIFLYLLKQKVGISQHLFLFAFQNAF